jgi:hypothetical protein
MPWTFVLFILGCWAPLLIAAGEEGWTLEALMKSLSKVDSVDAYFHEQKTLAILEEPLITKGILRYRSPGYLKKQTLDPHQETFQVDGDWVILETPEEGRRHLSLKGYPSLRALVESLRATLAGDVKNLKRFYRLQLQGQPTDWMLRLEPLDSNIANHVTAIVIHGQTNQIVRVETREAGGDLTIMRITPIYEE